MGMYFRDKDGNETLIAGMGRSGELVPSVSYYQSGTASFSDITSQATETVTITLDTAMPDTDYVVILNVANGVGYVVTSKSASAFTVRLQNLRTSTVSAGSFTWQAFKLMTDESRALDEAQINENTTDIATIEGSLPYKIDRVRYSTVDTSFPNSLTGSGIVTWLNARETTSVFRKPGIYIVELYNNSTDNYGYFFIQNLGTQGASTTAGYGLAEFKTYYTAGGRPFYFLLKQGTWSLMHDANNLYLETSSLTSTVTSGSTAPLTSGGAYTALNTVSSGTATINSAGAKSGTCSWRKIGRLVEVIIGGVTFNDATNSPTCFTGLPKALVQMAIIAVKGTVVRSGATQCGSYLVNMMVDGSISKGGSEQVTSADGVCYGSFFYLSAS